jgi:hypothetical protein
MNVEFCRIFLNMTLADLKAKLPTPWTERRAAWVYNVGTKKRPHYEFHFKDFFWHGTADNAYDARAKGWSAFMRSEGVED